MLLVDMMHYRILLFVLTCLASLCGCDRGLYVSLKQAGDNKEELRRTLSHYHREFKESKSESDRDKLLATKFLIKNMPGHYAMVGKYKEYYDACKRVFREKNLSASDRADSLNRLSDRFASEIDYKPLIEVIKSEYLVKDIDMAYKQWKEGDWAKHLDFDCFCEYLLPFTCSQVQPIFDWRTEMRSFAYGSIGNLYECYDYEYDPSAAITRVNSLLKEMIQKQRKVIQPHEIPIFDDSLFVMYPNSASCNENAELVTLIMRSKGLPVTIDYTPQWPDRRSGHSWNSFWSIHGNSEIFNPFTSNPGYPFFKHQRIAKVFRRTFSANKEYLKKIKSQKHIVQTTGSEFFKDVSEEYMATSDIKIKLFKRVRSRVAFIAVFDNDNWHPIWYGKTRGKNAFFTKMGRDVAYIVLAFEDAKLIPFSYPFILNRLGQVSYVIPNDTSTINLHLNRKYPMHQHVYLVSTLRNGVFEASNDKKKWVPLDFLPKWPLTSGIRYLNTDEKYRYWRFCSTNTRVSDMAEVFFYGINDTTPRFDYSVVENNNGFEKLFDNDPLTYYSAKGEDYYGCVDFGVPIQLSKIEYILRGDGNAIMPGDYYEVAWWKMNHWEHIQTIKANDVFLDIEMAPKDALFYIKNISSGSENRIFVWDNDKKDVIWH